MKCAAAFCSGELFDVGAEAGVDHQGDVQRLLGLGLKHVDLLRHSFFQYLERFHGKVGRGTIVVVENANQNRDEVHVHFDGVAR